MYFGYCQYTKRICGDYRFSTISYPIWGVYIIFQNSINDLLPKFEVFSFSSFNSTIIQLTPRQVRCNAHIFDINYLCKIRTYFPTTGRYRLIDCWMLLISLKGETANYSIKFHSAVLEIRKIQLTKTVWDENG